MSLKNKIRETMNLNNGNDYYEGLDDADTLICEAITLFVSARDFPEKHPELMMEFKEKFCPGDCTEECMPTHIKENPWDTAIKWRDWLFKKIINGDDDL